MDVLTVRALGFAVYVGGRGFGKLPCCGGFPQFFFQVQLYLVFWSIPPSSIAWELSNIGGPHIARLLLLGRPQKFMETAIWHMILYHTILYCALLYATLLHFSLQKEPPNYRNSAAWDLGEDSVIQMFASKCLSTVHAWLLAELLGSTDIMCVYVYILCR